MTAIAVAGACQPVPAPDFAARNFTPSAEARNLPRAVHIFVGPHDVHVCSIAKSRLSIGVRARVED